MLFLIFLSSVSFLISIYIVVFFLWNDDVLYWYILRSNSNSNNSKTLIMRINHDKHGVRTVE